MSKYERVLPRDRFNEASLLKCYAQLWIALEEKQDKGKGQFVQESVDHFDIDQDPSSGGIYIGNLTFTIDGVKHYLARPLNSRDHWPLYVVGNEFDPDFEEVKVFDDQGNLSEEMIRLLNGP